MPENSNIFNTCFVIMFTVHLDDNCMLSTWLEWSFLRFIFCLQVPGLVNVDFADVRSVMSDAGSSLMGIGTATG